LERVSNKEITKIMQAEETVLDRIETRKLRWFVHVMPEERWPAVIHPRNPVGRRKRRRPRQSWRYGVKDAMGKGGWGRRRPGPDSLRRELGRPPYKPIYICALNSNARHIKNT
jgi:hypothetical protein